MTDSPYRIPHSIPLPMVISVFVVLRPQPDSTVQPISMSNRGFTSEINSSYLPGNAEVEIRVDALTGDPVVDNCHPRTELGRTLLALRRAYVISGELLDDDAFDAEVQSRRGG